MSDQGDATIGDEQVEALRATAAGISRELTELTGQVGALVAAIDTLTPPATPSEVPEPVTKGPVSTPPPARVAPVSDPESDDGLEVTVTVAPLPELAMAAVAETTLRGLPGVRAIKGVKRQGDWARFTLDVTPGTDLVTEMKAAMPVSFKVRESTDEAVSLDLKWAWGTN